MKEIIELNKEIVELRKELLEQWNANHWEHCQNDWPHDGPCSWPLPEVLIAVNETVSEGEA